jgi:hypothetical protein
MCFRRKARYSQKMKRRLQRRAQRRAQQQGCKVLGLELQVHQ